MQVELSLGIVFPSAGRGSQFLIRERSLIRLHEYISDNGDPISSDMFPLQIRDYSHVTLETLARMMVEIAHDHKKRLVPGHIDSLPLTCSYNMRTMMDFIKQRRAKSIVDDSSTAMGDFATLYEVARIRWPSPV